MNTPIRPALSPDAVFFLPQPAVSKDEPPGPKLYFFKGHQFAIWDVMLEAPCAGYPREIDECFAGLLDVGMGRGIRAALQVPQWGQQVHFVFEGDSQVVTWDLDTHQLSPKRQTLEHLLPGIFLDTPVTPFYAELANGQSVIYAFSGMEYMRWTVQQDGQTTLDAGFPRKTASDWKDGLVLAPRCGVYLEWPNRSSAHSNRKIYCFMGDLYLRWDVPSHTRNYRLDIVAGWKGWIDFR